jgi:hypothetical protein
MFPLPAQQQQGFGAAYGVLRMHCPNLVRLGLSAVEEDD